MSSYESTRKIGVFMRQPGKKWDEFYCFRTQHLCSFKLPPHFNKLQLFTCNQEIYYYFT